MKYIRTKDGIIYTNALQMADKNWQVKGKERYIKISNNLVEKVVDTIEELCDEYVVIEKESGKHLRFALDIWKRYGVKEKLIQLMALKHIEVFGSIWITLSNGAPRLEPVAKLNDKGELELL